MDSRSARRSLRNGAWACVHRCERRQAVRPQASPALHEHRPRSAQRRRLQTVAPSEVPRARERQTLTPAEVLGSLTSEAPVCGRYIRMQCIAPLRQAQLASSTRGLIRIARRRSHQSLKLTVPGARSLFCSRHDTARTLHASQRIGNSGAKLETRVRCGETL
jgi:hypothetical protein